jgi:hypothetical protein
LDEQFDELFKDASLDFKMRLEADALTNENAEEEEVVLDEYESDDELQKEDEEETEEHITKVSEIP